MCRCGDQLYWTMWYIRPSQTSQINGSYGERHFWEGVKNFNQFEARMHVYWLLIGQNLWPLLKYLSYRFKKFKSKLFKFLYWIVLRFSICSCSIGSAWTKHGFRKFNCWSGWNIRLISLTKTASKITTDFNVEHRVGSDPIICIQQPFCKALLSKTLKHIVFCHIDVLNPTRF